MTVTDTSETNNDLYVAIFMRMTTKLHLLEGDRFDWDVIHHEYGHYVQSIYNLSASPGGAHSLGENLAQRLGKDAGLRLAWGEGWPTFFGTSLQIARGLLALGIPNVGDTRYQDTEDASIDYNLESLVGGSSAGEDNELSVQRALWDLYDANADMRDNVSLGQIVVWNTLVEAHAHTLSEAWNAFAVAKTVKQLTELGAIFADQSVAPDPTNPPDGATVNATTVFQWKANGAGPSFRLNQFKVQFYNADFSTLLFQSAVLNTPSYTPTAGELATIQGLPTGSKWIVRGSNTSAPTTGEYVSPPRSITNLTFITSTDAVTVPEGGTQSFQVRLSAQPAATVNATVSRVSGDTDITVQIGAALSFTTANWNINQTVTLAAAEDIDAANGSATIRVSATGVPDKDVTATELENDTDATVVFVKDDGGCNGNTPCYASIQEALDVAGDGTTIRVAQGTYHENLFIDRSANFILEGGWDANFAIRSTDPALTVIDGDVTGDGQGDGSVLSATASTGVDVSMTVDRFTIQNGVSQDFIGGGGIRLYAPSGGTIGLEMTNNVVRTNDTPSTGGGLSALIFSDSAISVLLVNNIFEGNTSEFGGGISLRSFSSAHLTADLANNTIAGNDAFAGGGLYVSSSESGVTDVTLTKNIIWGNTANLGADIYISQFGNSTATVSASYNDINVLRNFRGHYNNLGHNLNLDPFFVNLPGGDLRLGAGSPVIDAGTSAGAPATDFEGQARPRGAGYDIGADETDSPPPLQVQVPNGGEIWPIRSTQTIRWNSIGLIGKIKVQLSRNGGATWTTLVASTANTGSKNWKVTKGVTTQARIRVCSVKRPWICDTSNANFTIQ